MKAMKEKMESMKVNQVWDLVDIPLIHKVIRIKRKVDGIIERYKVRLIAKAYKKKSIDYEETFSLVEIFASIRLILVVVAHLNLELYQIDIKLHF